MSYATKFVEIKSLSLATGDEIDLWFVGPDGHTSAIVTLKKEETHVSIEYKAKQDDKFCFVVSED